MPVLLLIVAVVIVVVVVLAATGRLGELPAERNDYAPLDLGPVSATDVALLRPPTTMWGYSVQATDEAMAQIAESIRERDVRIVALEQLVADLSREPAPPPLSSPYLGARHRRVLPAAGQAAEATEPAAATWPPEPARPAETSPPTEPAQPAAIAWPREVTWPADTGKAPEPTRLAEAAGPAVTPWPGRAGRPAKPERPADDGQATGEGQIGPPERSHG